MYTQGKMICVEGPDGVGKTTAVAALASYIQSMLGAEVTLVRLPGGTPRGEVIRQLFKTKAATMSVYDQIDLLCQAKHYALEEVIKPALAQGRYVICDRFTDSLFAYQWAGFSDFNPIVRQQIIDTLLLQQIDIFPDLKIVMSCDAGVAESRMRQERKTLDALDTADHEFKQRVRRYYEDFVEESPKGITVHIDTTPAWAVVHRQLSSMLERTLGHQFDFI